MRPRYESRTRRRMDLMTKTWSPAPPDAVLPRKPTRRRSISLARLPRQVEAIGGEDAVALHALHSLLRRIDFHSSGLVLRGSMLLRAHSSSATATRQPKDLDFVASRPITPGYVAAALRQATERNLDDDGVTFQSGAIVQSGTWLYSESPGVRFHLPWQFGPWQGGAQVDVALTESLPFEAVPTTIPGVVAGIDVSVSACTAEMALAWKLRWIVDDAVAQAKDTWDAICILKFASLEPVRLVSALNSVVTNDELPLFDLLVSSNSLGIPLESHWRELLEAISVNGLFDIPQTASEATELLSALVRTATESRNG